jgi:ATP-dependent Lhr-like helicase
MVFKKLDPKIQALISQRFKKPSVIQQKTIPKILSGKNVLAIANTGMGKTEAVFLPILNKIFQKKHKPNEPTTEDRQGISLLYLTPMRSLNRDMFDRLFWWCDKLELEIGVRHGDTPQSERNMQRELPPDVLITTPETLGAVLPGKVFQKHLKSVKYVIVDEIHELVENKRGVQLAVLLERLKNIAGNFQRIGLSATIGSPKKVANFLGKNIHVVQTEAEKHYTINVEVPKTTPTDRRLADKLFVNKETTARLRKIIELINNHNSTLVFTNTRQTAEVLASRLRKLDKTLKHGVHHGSLAKEVRIKGEQALKGKKIKSLICTSSLELGIDIGSIDLVIQYLSPRQVCRLVQRIGRSGHGLGRTSKGVIITGDEDVFESAVIAKKSLRKELEPTKIRKNSLDVLAHQIVGMCLDEYAPSKRKIYKTITRSYPFKSLSRGKFNEVLNFLASLRILWINPDGIKRTKRAWQYYFENLSTIADVRRVRVESIVEGEPVGYLDESFAAEHGEPGKNFVFNGRAWQVVQLEKNRLIVEPIDNIESAIPAWEGELIPVPLAVAEEVAELRKQLNRRSKASAMHRKPKVLATAKDEHVNKEMIKLIRKHKKTHKIPDNKNLLLESYQNFYILHACFGTKINNTIARHAASNLIKKTGVSVNIKNDPYRIIFQTLARSEDIIESLRSTDLKNFIQNSSIFKWRFLQVAKRFGVISRQASFDKLAINKIIDQYYGSPIHEETINEIFFEKLELKKAEKILNDIQKGRIKITKTRGLSYLGEIGLTHQFSEVMKPKRPEGEIFHAFSKRIFDTRLRLICTSCNKYSVTKRVKDIKEKESCPKCRSGLIAPVSVYDKEWQLKLKSKSGGLPPSTTSDEQTDVTKSQSTPKALRRSASLAITYGKNYFITQAGRGIGPETGARILAKLPKNEEDLLKAIYKAEKEYRRTRIYWD